MNYVQTINRLSKDDASVAGGKGASLGEMTRVGIPVPKGFVVLSSAFERFISNRIQESNKSKDQETVKDIIDRVLTSVNKDDLKSVQQASERIRSLILKTQMPEEIGNEVMKSFVRLNSKLVAVRSSATAEDSSSAAWAGQLESYLNTTKKNLFENLKKCWASLFTPRAIFYRFEKQLHSQSISIAVVVQTMIQSEKSGIAFSVHPVTQDRNQLIVEAGYGLGEAIVSGQITPDSYVIQKYEITKTKNQNSLSLRGVRSDEVVPEADPPFGGQSSNVLLEKTISTQEKQLIRGKSGGTRWKPIPKTLQNRQKLSDLEIVKLSELILKIEHHYHFPVDVEFALEKGKFYIVQSRPITTLLTKLDKGDFSGHGVSGIHGGNRMSTQTNPLDSKEIQKVKWIYVRSRELSILELSLMILSYEKVLPSLDLDRFGTYWLERTYIYWRGPVASVYRPESNPILAGVELSHLLTKHKNLFHIIYGRARREKKRITTIIKSLEQNFKNPKKDEWFKYYKQLKGAVLSFLPLDGLPTKFAEALEKINRKPSAVEKKVLLTWRKEIQDTELQLEKMLHDFVHKAQKVFGTDWSYWTDDELAQYFLNGKKPTPLILKKRVTSSLMVWSFRRSKPYEVFVGQRADNVGNLLKDLTTLVDESLELKGTAVYPGTAQGEVVVIQTKKDIEGLSAGSIVVARVLELDDFMLLTTKRIKALVSEEGGITSHIAISGREFKIPCIMSVKNATKLIKNGDLVNVDADDGVVKILKGSSR